MVLTFSYDSRGHLGWLMFMSSSYFLMTWPEQLRQGDDAKSIQSYRIAHDADEIRVDKIVHSILALFLAFLRHKCFFQRLGHPDHGLIVRRGNAKPVAGLHDRTIDDVDLSLSALLDILQH